MTFTKSILLGAAAAITGVASAQAADLPSRKAAPVEYVRVCDAYGAGFFFIPGTQTCLRIGGRVRADYAYVPAKDIFSGLSAAGVPTISSFKDAQHTVGWEARARISFDTRTQTAWGVVQAAGTLRMSRATGVLGDGQDVTTAHNIGAGSTLETAFVRFAGFTFGAARENFTMMPALVYGAGHWNSFANGAKQLAYTHVFGGGFSATIALQDYLDTAGTNSGVDNAPGTPRIVSNSLPQVVGRLELTQGWGSVAVAGAFAKINADNGANTYGASETVWAVNAGATINLPMLAQGSKLYLTAAYADGMTEYTTRFTSFVATAFRRDVAGYVMNHPSYVYEPTGIQTVKSWNVAALLEHYWTPQYRSVLFGSYGALDAPASAKALAWNGTTGFGDATVWNVGKQIAWLPTRDFEIGVEVIYARVSQDVRAAAVAPAVGVLTKQSESSLTGRLRVERNF